MHVMITADSIDDVRNLIPCDQAEDIIPGCESWTFPGDPEGGCITRWPCGTGAVSWGAESQWGQWRGKILVLEETGAHVSEYGEIVGSTGEKLTGVSFTD